MRKLISLLLCMFLLTGNKGALSAGKLLVDQENFLVVTSFWTYGYVFAKVSNAGDKPIKVNAGVLEIYDEAGDAITSSDFLSAHAEYLEPGEYTYVKMSSEIENGTASDYMLTVTGKSDSSRRTQRLPVETDLQLGVKSGWWTSDYMYATVTNDTDQPIYDIGVVMALLDAEGNILDVEDDNLYSDRALTPGSSMIIRKEISSSYMEYYEKKGMVPVAVDAIAYVNVDVN